MQRIVIVGGSLAGLRAAEALRAKGFDGTITVIDGQGHAPYDRPPLTKKYLTGDLGQEQIELRKPDDLAALELDLRLGTWAEALDVSARTIKTSTGELPYDGLILATGLSPRRIPTWPQLAGVHVVRTLDDADGLRADLERGPSRVAIVGGGFIGLEAAAAARQMGLEVTVVEPLPAPLVRGLGPRMGLVLADVHRARGVDLRLATGVEGPLGDTRIEGLRLSDGSTLAADVVVVAVGASPVTGWLDTSGLEVRDGVVCDATLACGPGIFAAGDVCRWVSPRYGEVRIEHWTNATEQGAWAAENLLAHLTGGELRPFDPVPFVWSDQYELKVQVLGRISGDDHVEVVHGDTATPKFVALYGRAGRLTGVLGVSMARLLMPFRRLLEEGASWSDALSLAESQRR
jgi:NADPH-dependent 2,4-dienoyl-CoA reductase/sulfur reductase-like enzyme